ncbi:pseudouridine synthase [Sphingobacterium corticibacter]|uniref:Pseudouridine synthase n=1 Tax=Sphingobacterium corticibacter TaxID=2171749 RepID=A0A2T8HER5_9SPHI|nr:pseudouridine synthase [Sphingobacterium corticibacter]PVH23931.1 pseudouridylate synthase [Sphingobacterium corticibacter]
MPFNNKRNSRDDSARRGRNNEDSRSRSNDRPKSNFSSSDKRFNKDSRGDENRSRGTGEGFAKKSFGDRTERKPYNSDNRRSSEDRKSYNSDNRRSSEDRKPYNSDNRRSSEDRKPYNSDNRRSSENRGGNRDFEKKAGFSRNSSSRPDFKQRDGFNRKPFNDRDEQGKGAERTNLRSRKTFGSGDGDEKTYFPNRRFAQARKPASGQAIDDGTIRLNRYISNSGICSRRKADELIEQGLISVNGEIVTELGTKVDPAKDEIRYNNERLKREKMVYVLLNKPKDYITTTDDPQERRTVMQLVSKATKERIYPVGRLDRNTTGLLLLTNDGNLAEKLSHPRNNISKMYHVELDKSLSQGDMNKIEFGIELEDGLIKPDEVSYVTGASKKEVGIQIHSGKNRIVRRIFEHLGYEVVKLDRVVYANLTKKDLPRGRWRYLEERELIQLKHLMK